MTRIRTLPIGLALGCALLVGACTDERGDEASTPAPTTAAPSTSEPAPTREAPADDANTTTAPPELGAEGQDEADIEATLQAYTKALNDAFNGEASVEGIYPYSRDTAREQWVTEVLAAEAQGIDFSGVTQLGDLRIVLDGSTAEVVACADVTDVEAVDGDGSSILAEDRLDRTTKEYVLARDTSAEVGWYVVEDTNRNEPCEG